MSRLNIAMGYHDFLSILYKYGNIPASKQVTVQLPRGSIWRPDLLMDVLNRPLPDVGSRRDLAFDSVLPYTFEPSIQWVKALIYIWCQNNNKKNTLKIWCAMRVLDEKLYLWSHSGNRSVQIISKCRANEIHARHFSGRPTQRIENRIVSWNANGETFRVRWGNIVASLLGRTAQKCGSITLLHRKLKNHMPCDNTNAKIHNIYSHLHLVKVGVNVRSWSRNWPHCIVRRETSRRGKLLLFKTVVEMSRGLGNGLRVNLLLRIVATPLILESIREIAWNNTQVRLRVI